jgi:hypothetical protein
MCGGSASCWVSPRNDPEVQARITAFRQGLEALAWTEARNIRIDYRFAGGDADRVRAYVAELVASAQKRYEIAPSHCLPRGVHVTSGTPEAIWATPQRSTRGQRV